MLRHLACLRLDYILRKPRDSVGLESHLGKSGSTYPKFQLECIQKKDVEIYKCTCSVMFHTKNMKYAR
jgi:hypothetical protein